MAMEPVPVTSPSCLHDALRIFHLARATTLSSGAEGTSAKALTSPNSPHYLQLLLGNRGIAAGARQACAMVLHSRRHSPSSPLFSTIKMSDISSDGCNLCVGTGRIWKCCLRPGLLHDVITRHPLASHCRARVEFGNTAHHQKMLMRKEGASVVIGIADGIQHFTDFKLSDGS